MSVISVPGLLRNGVVEKFGDGDSWTATVGAAQAVSGGLLVESMTGDRIVRTAQANSILAVGVAMWDGAAGDMVTVASEGVWFLTASGSIGAGQRVVPAASGAVAAVPAVTTPTPGDVTNSRAIIGIALADATNGNLVPVKLAL